MNNEEEGPLSISEVAQKLHVSQQTIRRMLTRGELEAFTVGKSIRIVPSEVRRIMNEKFIRKIKER